MFETKLNEKNNRKLIFILLCWIFAPVIYFLFFLRFDYCYPDYYEQEYSQFYYPLIIINGNDDWEDLLSEPWCIGSGTKDDPYIIENLSINALNHTYGIEIHNSDVYFIIKGISFTQIGEYGGIYLKNVKNGKIIDNFFIRTDQYNYPKSAIFIDNCYNITIEENEIYSKGSYAIYLHNSYDNIITNNYINWLGQWDIFLEDSSENLITNNQLIRNGIGFNGNYQKIINNFIDSTNLVRGKDLYFYKNIFSNRLIAPINIGQIILANCSNLSIKEFNILEGSGLHLIHCQNITIQKSLFYKNRYGIFLKDNNNINIIENSITSYDNLGIYSAFCNNILIKNNYVAFNLKNAIELYNNHRSNILNNTIKQSGIGIKLIKCFNINIAFNNINNNKMSGIIALNCNDIEIEYNSIRENYKHGILMINSKNNDISENLIQMNEKSGILLNNSVENLICKNNINSNKEKGIYIIGNDNKVLKNRIELNINGIHLENSKFCEIMENLIINSGESGISLESSHYNLISENTVNLHQIGIEIHSSRHNRIIKNDFSNNINSLIMDNSYNNSFFGNIGILDDDEKLSMVIIIIVIIISIINLISLFIVLKKLKRKADKSIEHHKIIKQEIKIKNEDKNVRNGNFCALCGARINSNYKFCVNCGKELI
ncbi:MAG: NosD domain-containing protein [Candidatus Helarchaeota archaeon]